MTKTLRILYAAGLGNVIGSYQHWVKGEDDPSQVAITYSGQFYEVCREVNAQAYVISRSKERKFLRDGQFIIEHRPIPLNKASGILYHLGKVWYGLGLIASAVRFRANVAVVSEGTTHWFVLSILSWVGVAVIPSLHCVLWRKFSVQSSTEKLLLRLSRSFFRKHCVAILVVSDEIGEQVAKLTDGYHSPILRSFPIYRRTQFEGIGEPDDKYSPFRVLFVGRIEKNKGVFDLLEIAKRFAAEGRHDIHFDLCGTGSVLEPLRQAAKQAGVESFFVCHDHCNKPQMREMFNRAHIFIVPTTTDFIEGFNKVVVEAVLSGRPVVTSSVCTDLSQIRDGVVEVPPDDIKSYGDALLKLYENREFYEEKRQGCLGLQEQFYDYSQSWGAKLKSILVAIQRNV